MEAEYMLACGIVWRKTADPAAGWELIEGLASKSPQIRLLAKLLLVECGEPSMSLLENAVATGAVNLDSAATCMAEILRTRNQTEDWTACERTLN